MLPGVQGTMPSMSRGHRDIAIDILSTDSLQLWVRAFREIPAAWTWAAKRAVRNVAIMGILRTGHRELGFAGVSLLRHCQQSARFSLPCSKQQGRERDRTKRRNRTPTYQLCSRYPSLDWMDCLWWSGGLCPARSFRATQSVFGFLPLPKSVTLYSLPSPFLSFSFLTPWPLWIYTSFHHYF